MSKILIIDLFTVCICIYNANSIIFKYLSIFCNQIYTRLQNTVIQSPKCNSIKFKSDFPKDIINIILKVVINNF